MTVSNPKSITEACAHLLIYLFKYSTIFLRSILISVGEELVHEFLYLFTHTNFVRELLLVEAVVAINSNIFRSLTVARPENLNKKL